MQLANGISMNGTAGYIKEKEGKVIKAILVNGSALKYGKMNLNLQGVITGKVLNMNRELAGGGWLITDTKLPADGSLNGEQIIVATDYSRDASYTIRNVVRENGLTKIFCGPISFVSDFKGGNN